MADRVWGRLDRLPLSEKEKGLIAAKLIDLPQDKLESHFPPLSDEAVAVLLKERHLGKRPSIDASFCTKSTLGRTSKRMKAFEEYMPTCVGVEDLLTPADPVLVSLRWLFLLVHEGRKVDLTALRRARRWERDKIRENMYYPGVLAFLKAASWGQDGLQFGGQGYGNLKRPDMQGIIGEKVGAPIEVKKKIKGACDWDPQGVISNAEDIKQEVDYLKHEMDDDSARTVLLGCMFCRMDRFWLIKYDKITRTVEVCPAFPRLQKPFETPQQVPGTDSTFVLMDMRLIDAYEERKVRLSDVVPAKPKGGFHTLVGYVEKLQELFDLPRTRITFVGSSEILATDLKPIAHGRKSIVLFRRSTRTVLKVTIATSTEKSIHNATDGHENLRSLVDCGSVNVGCETGVFQFLELEGYGDPFTGAHVADLASMEKMWNQAYAGLRHLHSRGVLHRDLKPDNMLVFNQRVLKINDYDVSCFKNDTAALRDQVGTRGFISPSSMQPYREEDDILSLALTFYALRMDVKNMGVEAASRKRRLHILREELHPNFFPEVVRLSVKAALDALEELGVIDEDDEDEDDEDIDMDYV